MKKQKCKAIISRLARKEKKWLSREEITTFRFERRLCLSKHAEQDSTENGEPKQVTQERECDLQNYFDDKAQQEENDKPKSFIELSNNLVLTTELLICQMAFSSKLDFISE